MEKPNQRKRIRRQKVRRISDSTVSEYVTGTFLLIIGLLSCFHLPIGVQQIIVSYNAPDLVDLETLYAHSFPFLILTSMVLGSLLGRIFDTFEEGKIKSTGLILGCNLGYLAYILLAVMLTGHEVYTFALAVYGFMTAVVGGFSSVETHFPSSPRPGMIK